MKHLFFTLFALFFSAPVFAGNCVDLSGDYSPGVDALGRTAVFTLQQTACDSIGIGSYSVVNGQVQGDVIAPVIEYVNEANPELCPHAKCTTFQIVADGIEFQRNSSISVNGRSCSYSKVKWSLNKDGLLQTYYLLGDSPFCRQPGGIFTKTLNRFEQN